jgi:uncharacterized protein (DUF486 family)
MALVMFCLSIGMITGELDWVLVYYGCAPKAKQEKMNGPLILRIAFGSLFLCAMLFGISALSQRIGFNEVSTVLHKIVLEIVMLMILVTFHLSTGIDKD